MKRKKTDRYIVELRTLDGRWPGRHYSLHRRDLDKARLVAKKESLLQGGVPVTIWKAYETVEIPGHAVRV